MKIKEKILKRCESKFCAQCEPWQGGEAFPELPGKLVCAQPVSHPPRKFSPNGQKSKFVPNSSRGHKANFPQPARKASLCPIRSAATRQIFPNQPRKQVCAQPAPQPQRKFSPTSQKSKFVPSQLRSHKAKETRFAKQISSLISGRQMLIRTSAKNKLLPITSDQILRHP